MPIHVHRSNRAERLVDVLADVVSQPLASPWLPECIVVQGRGMERWLSMELSRRLGIWANPLFPFPRRLVESILDAVLGGRDGIDVFAPEVVSWRIAARLPPLLPLREFAPLRAYLDHDENNSRLLHLAGEIATTFDQYLTYRPDLLLQWENGTGRGWQPRLWQVLTQQAPPHVAARVLAAIAALGRTEQAPDSLPQRFSLFGVGTLAPMYLDLIHATGRFCDVHLFLLSPCRQYWADASRELDGEAPPLLASLGRLGRDFLNALEERGQYQESEVDLHDAPAGDTMLSLLQGDLLEYRRRGIRDTPPAIIAPTDESITVHSCHGAMREVEVLHDHLRALFEDPQLDLQPHEVVVMSPSIEDYATAIDAVFGAAGEGAQRIPYLIADRSARAISPLADALIRTLEALEGRLSIATVLDLLGLDVVAQHLRLGDSVLDRIQHWLITSGVRWGIDAEHRRDSGQPPLNEHTWRFGTDRLLLGYVLPSDAQERLFHGVLPFDDIEGSAAIDLGRGLAWCAKLFGLQERARTAQNVEAWSVFLGDCLTLFLESPANSYEHEQIRDLLRGLVDVTSAAGFDGVVDLPTMRQLLDAELNRNPAPRGFLSHGITFCALVPMRSIPFRVVVLLGMNDGQFPRREQRAGYDLIAEEPRPGDRSRRDDDRYLFLESLLSARERLIVTYTGRSLRDNTPIPPAIPVSELLDSLDESFCRADEEPVRTQIVLEHPLQPFSSKSFEPSNDTRRGSYAADFFAGAVALTGLQHEEAPFIAAALPEPTTPDALDLDRFIRFFDNPPRGFLQQRLGIYLASDAEQINEREPIELNALEEWKVGDYMLGRPHLDASQAESLLRARGDLPPGALGSNIVGDVGATVSLLQSAAAGIGERRDTPVPVDLAFGGLHVLGTLRDIRDTAQLALTYSKLRAKRVLAAWIRHLILLSLDNPMLAQRTVVIGCAEKDKDGILAYEFGPVESPLQHLEQLALIFKAGHCLPLPLPLDEALKFVQETQPTSSPKKGKGKAAVPKDETVALDAARKTYEPKDRGYASGADPYFQLAFRGRDIFDPTSIVVPQQLEPCADFRWLARTIFLPLLTHRRGMP